MPFPCLGEQGIPAGRSGTTTAGTGLMGGPGREHVAEHAAWMPGLPGQLPGATGA